MRLCVAAAVVALSACGGGRSAVTTTTTPGPVDRQAPFLRVVTAESKPPCRAGQVPGFGTEQDGKCFALGTTLARADGLSSYRVSCTDPSVGWNILLAFDRDAGAQISSFTRAHVGTQLALVEDGVVVFASRVSTPVGRDFTLTNQDFHASALRRIGARSGAREQASGTNGLPPTPPGSPSTLPITPIPTVTPARIGRCKANDD
jgi:hypothetical protein